MVSPIESERSEASSPRSPKQEKAVYPSYDSDEWETLSEDMRLLDEEWRKSEGFDVDFSNLRLTFGCGAVDLDDCDLVSVHESDDTNRDLLNRLSNMAISYYKHETGISLEFVKVLRANYHGSAGVTYYMTFEANDSSHGNQTKRFQAVVGHFPGDIDVGSCRPQPSSWI